MKSVQLWLNELDEVLHGETVTTSAYTQARAKFSYTAFIELNQKAVVDVMYSDDNIQRYKGMRLLGVDGTKIRLPDEKEINRVFGQISYTNEDPNVKGSHTYGMGSVLYDVFNHVALDSVLSTAKAYEVDLAISHLAHCDKNDLILYDRNYASYTHLSLLSLRNQHFVIRCSAASFAVARKMLKGEGESSQVVTLQPHHSKRKEIQGFELPEEITVRFVRVQLETGEYEVLVTNLLDNVSFPTLDFLTIYHWRWGIESFYAILKTRLMLENFSGKTVESVLQDFYSVIYLSGLETLLTRDTNRILATKSTEHPQQVNHAVSFHAIKHKALALLYSNESTDKTIARLESLFFTNPVSVRNKRNVPRKKSPTRQLLDHAKRRKKICF